MKVQNENDTKMCKQKLIWTTQLILKNTFLSEDAFMKNLKSYNQLLLHEKWVRESYRQRNMYRVTSKDEHLVLSSLIQNL